jgi:hypothetical protein
MLVGLALLLGPGSAAAQVGSTCQAYNPELCKVAASGRTATSAGTLPFTGFDLVLLGGGGSALLALGLALRRRVRRPS